MLRGRSLRAVVLGAVIANGACEGTAIHATLPHDAGPGDGRANRAPEPDESWSADVVEAPDVTEALFTLDVAAAPRASVVQLAVGGDHSCALLSTGQVRCWGWNESGEIGDGTTNDHYSPTPVLGVVDATAIAAGNHFTCALLADQTVKCWGYNGEGQVGIGTQTLTWPYSVPTPAQVLGLHGVVQLAAGAAHACALLEDATVECWGDNRAGQLGDGTTSDRAMPVPISGFAGALAVAPGGFQTYSRMSEGIVLWSGSYAYGDLALVFNSLTPVAAQTLPGMVRLSAGSYHACVVLDSGVVQCWGENTYGELGDGTTTSSLVPVDVPGLVNIVGVAASSEDTCALAVDGAVACWGRNSYGELGDGTNTQRPTPVWVPGLTNVVEISVGGDDTCARLADGSVWCWGENMHGQIGDGTTSNRYVPTLVEALP